MDAPPPSPSSVPSARLVWGYAAGQFGTGLLPLIVTSWILYFYSPPPKEAVLVLLSPGLFGLIRLVERIAAAAIEPLVGHLSDRSQSRFGRRLPFIALGLPFLVGSFVLLWFPPAAATSDDLAVIVHLALCLMIFFASYTVVVAPYVSLLPELFTSPADRVRVSVRMSIFEVASNVLGALAAGALISAGSAGLLGFSNGYQLLGVVMGALALASFLPVLLVVRERGAQDVPAVRFSFGEALRRCLENPQFWPYTAGVAGFRFATTCAVVGLPFFATELMGTSEDTAGLLMAVIIVVATLLFPLVERLARRHGKARVFRLGALGYVLLLPLTGTLGLTPLPPLLQGALLFALTGFSTATAFVLPRALLTDVIDLDERRTGYRREAMYNGASGLLEKLGEALGSAVVAGLCAWLGSTAAQPLGLRLIGLSAALGLGLAMLGFRRYHLEG